MTCFTKGQKTKRPRCEATTTRGERCQFQSKQFINGRAVCRHHSKEQEAK